MIFGKKKLKKKGNHQWMLNYVKKDEVHAGEVPRIEQQ